MFSSRLPENVATNHLTDAVRARRARGEPFIDLTLSNPTRAGFDYPADLLAPLGDARALRYAPSPLGAIDARRAVSADYARQGVDVPPDRIALTASTSDGYSLLFKLLADAGDEVLVPRPSYPLFDHLTRLDLVVSRHYDLDADGAWAIDFDSLERAITRADARRAGGQPEQPDRVVHVARASSIAWRRSVRRAASRSSPTRCSPTTSSNRARQRARAVSRRAATCCRSRLAGCRNRWGCRR